MGCSLPSSFLPSFGVGGGGEGRGGGREGGGGRENLTAKSSNSSSCKKALKGRVKERVYRPNAKRKDTV